MKKSWATGFFLLVILDDLFLSVFESLALFAFFDIVR